MTGPTDARPLTVRIADDIRSRIDTGEYQTGARLPSLERLATEFGASVTIVRDALDLLRQQGRVVSRQGAGTFVRSVGPRRRIVRGRLIRRDPARGYVMPATQDAREPWQVHGTPRAAPAPCPPAIASLFEVPAGTPVMRRRRVTSPLGEAPFQIADSWIHPDVLDRAPQAGEPDTGPGGYLDRIEEAGHGPLSWQEVFLVRQPTQEEARLLGIAQALAVIEIQRIGTSAQTGVAAEVTVCVIPSDRVEFMTDLERDTSAAWPTTPPTGRYV